MNTPLVVLALVAALAVSTTGVARAEPMAPPLTLHLSGPKSVAAGDELTLTLELRRPVPNAVPILLDVTLPAGVTLLSKPPGAPIVDARTPRLVRTLRVRVDRVPAAALVVTADSRTSTFGVHATARYRFGRPDPTTPAPAPKVALRTREAAVIGRPVMLPRTAPISPQPPRKSPPRPLR